MRFRALPTLVLVVAAAPARAQGSPPTPTPPPEPATVSPCGGTPGRPWIRVESNVPTFVESFRAEVAPEGFDVCRGDGETPPVATVSVVASEGSPTVEVLDVVTAKRVSRAIDLRSIPADGRDLALAVAADELLHASWAELALVNAPPPAAPVPEPVHRAVESSVRSVPAAPTAKSGEIGVMLAGEVFTGGQAQWGADARTQWFLSPHFAATLRLGLRATLPKETPEGEVRASAVLGGVGGAYRALVSSRVDLDLFARFDAADVTYVADTTIHATASSGSAVAFLLGAGGAIGWSVMPSLRLSAELGASAPVRPVRATEGETNVVVGVSGVGAVAGIGAGGLF
jgi:hypothetical protein